MYTRRSTAPLSLELHGNPDHGSGVDQPPYLTVDGPRLAIDDKECLVGRGDHVVAEHPRRGDGSVGVAPLRQWRVHRLAHARDHLHFPC